MHSGGRPKSPLTPTVVHWGPPIHPLLPLVARAGDLPAVLRRSHAHILRAIPTGAGTMN